MLSGAGVNPADLFERRGAGDWGVIEGKSWYLNRVALDGRYGCVVSAYAVLSDVQVVILTQADHSNTVVASPTK